MAQVSLDMYQTLAIAVVALLIGAWLKTKIKVLDRLCIPSPVVGGLLLEKGAEEPLFCVCLGLC